MHGQTPKIMTREVMKQPLHTPVSTAQTQSPNVGLLAGIAAYTMWGFFPIYFIVTAAASPLEILVHRVVWSVPFAFLLIMLRGQIPALKIGLKNKKILFWLTVSSFFIAINWGVYIWAIQIDQIFQASLGYYINPLMYVLVGVLFFKEKLSKLQSFAIVLAAIGVGVLTIYGGIFPWISLMLAISFTVYGVVRKQVDIGAIPGLLIETLILLLPALAYGYYIYRSGTLTFAQGDSQLTALLLLAGPLTVLPLLCFAVAARKLRLSTLGILQYIGPTLQFLCGLYFGEKFTTAHAICFTLIWIAVALFSWNAWKTRPRVLPA